MIPALRGYSCNVAFLGRNTSLMFVKLAFKVSGWQVVLPQDQTILRFSKYILQSSLEKILPMIPVSIHSLLEEK